MFIVSVRRSLKIKSENDRIFAEGECAMKSRFVADFAPELLTRPDVLVVLESVRKPSGKGSALL